MKFLVVMLCIIPVLPGADADELGRLFFTPQQRAQLEREHARMAAADDDPADVLRLDGIVQKSGGARTIWINGKVQNADSGGERAPDTQTLTVAGKAQPIKIKVGQHLLLEQVTAE